MMHGMPEKTVEQIIAEHYSDLFAGVHEAANLFPMCDAETMVDLRTRISTEGLLVPIVRERKTRLLIDGRNRLMACHAVHIEPRIVDEDIEDPIAYVLALNLSRRHLSTGQRAMVGDDAREMYSRMAKERQGKRNDLNIVVNSPQCDDEPAAEEKSKTEHANKAREQAGKAVGVGGQAIDRARDLKVHAPELADAVRRGEKSLNEAHTQAKPAIQAAKRREREIPQSKPASMQFINIIGVDGTEYPYAKPTGKATFNQTNDSVGWAKWTWNPVTGCLHGCEYCYAREIANSSRMADIYPAKFVPVFHPQRIDAPSNTRFPDSEDPTENRVFVGSMADLFGTWIKTSLGWHDKIFKACMAAPQWEYLFLTKWPQRYRQFTTLPHAWFGASVTAQKDVKRVERYMASFKTTGVKWVSLEPMREAIRFDDLSWCDLMVIGAQTATNQPADAPIPGHVSAFAPPFEWVADVVAQCTAAGVPVYLKENLKSGPGMVWPAAEPLRRGK